MSDYILFGRVHNWFCACIIYFYRLGADGPTRACLAISMKYVMDVQPAIFVTENVRGSIADRVKELTRKLYEVDVVAGCPQDVGFGCNRRDREFVVGVHRGKGAPGTQGQAVLYMANIYMYIYINIYIYIYTYIYLVDIHVGRGWLGLGLVSSFYMYIYVHIYIYAQIACVPGLKAGLCWTLGKCTTESQRH
jgi:hypothetical protein